MKTWIDELEEFIEDLSHDEFSRLVELAASHLWCRQCGTCCIIPELKEVNKPKGVRCQHLTMNNLCAIQENKPRWCQLFPYINNYEWMMESRVAGGSLEAAIGFCGVVKAFWEFVYEEIRTRKDY